MQSVRHVIFDAHRARLYVNTFRTVYGLHDLRHGGAQGNGEAPSRCQPRVELPLNGLDLLSEPRHFSACLWYQASAGAHQIKRTNDGTKLFACAAADIRIHCACNCHFLDVLLVWRVASRHTLVVLTAHATDEWIF